MRWSDNKKREWHRWFAWYPLTIISDDRKSLETYWLETIYRKKKGYRFNNYWTYSIEKPED